MLYRKGEHVSLVESFPSWLESNIDTSLGDSSIFHALDIYLTVLSGFGLIAESKLLPEFDEYMEIFFKLKCSDKISLMPDALFEKHLLILVDGYSQIGVAKEEYFTHVRMKRALGEPPSEKVHQIYSLKIEQKSGKRGGWVEAIRGNQLFVSLEKFAEKLNTKLKNPRAMGIGATLFFVLLIVFWIRKHVPRFWSRMLASSSLLAYSLLAPI